MESYYVIETTKGNEQFERITHYVDKDRNNNLVVYSKLSNKQVKVFNSNHWLSVSTCLL